MRTQAHQITGIRTPISRSRWWSGCCVNVGLAIGLRWVRCWVVEGQPFWDAAQKSWFLTPSVPSILDALEQAYARGRGRSKKAVEFAKQYEADHVYETHWKPAMKEIAEWCRLSQS